MSKEDVILSKLDNLISWVKKIDHKVEIQNGKVNQNVTDIATLMQWKEMRTKATERLETMSREKIVAIIGGFVLFAVLISLFLIKRWITNATM